MPFDLFLPPPAISAALAASITMPLLLVGYAHGPFRRLSLGQRFWAAMGTAATLWVIMIVWLLTGAETRAYQDLMFDATAGAAILLTAGIVVYSIWALASFGFTVLMLICLDKIVEPLSLETWANSYGQGHGMRAFTQDRIAVLIGIGLADERDGKLRLIGGFAARFAAFVLFVAHVFAVAIEK